MAMIKSKISLPFVFVGIAVLLIVAIFMASRNLQKGIRPTTNTSPQKNDVAITKSSIYRNVEFGFEFSVPYGWQVEENLYKSPYSYFNLTLMPLREKATYSDPVAVNIVKSEFIEMSYRDMKPTDSTILVDGVKGVKYEYAFEGGDNIDIILPRTQNTFMIGCRKGYDDVFNGVVSSFKFTR
jgi:hypothetical protein